MIKIRLEKIAKQRIESFAKLGKAHLYLAYHAAFPLALTPDLLYRLWVQFQRDIDDQVLGIPWVAVADLLVSSLCNEVGHELYEMDLTVRNLLLSSLQEDKKFGQQRINELSNFLLDYVRPKLESKDPDIQDFALTQQWTALAYTQPNKVAHELALEFENLNHKDTAGVVRIASLTEIFTEPLADFQPLLIYARVMGKFARGNLEAAKDELRKVGKEGDVIQVAGVSLSIPEQIKPNQKKQTLIRRLLLKIPLARVASVAGMIVTTLLSVGVGFGVYQWSTPCSAGQEKSLGIICRDFIASNPVDNKVKISRGDRTLFPDTKNSDRDQGFKSFEKGNYTEAEKLFKQAFANNKNRPDPEVLIYQNNARAIQQGSPLTLAAVVPATNRPDLALEMLRGIAQAQNLFNQQGRLKNGRLLEIVIADDQNEADIAKLVAEELVKDESLLGIIGHSSSHVTQEALNTYEKAKLPVISPTSSSTKLQQSKFFFRTAPSDEATAKKLTEYALKEKINKVIIFCNPKDPYSDSIREEFRTQFENGNKGQIFEKPCIDIADPDFNEDKIKVLLGQYQPQAILLFPDTQHLTAAITTIKARKEWLDNIEPKQRPDIKLLGVSSLFSNRILQEAGDAVEGLVVVVPWFRNAVKSISFTNVAENQWGVKVGWYTASSFDATQVFIESFKPSLNPSKSTILLNLPKVRLSPENTSGEEVTFDRNTREMKRDEKLLKVENGKFVVMLEAN